MPPVLRVQVGSEATSSILLVDNATYVPLIRSDAACYAALGVLCVCGRRGRVLMGQAAGASRALLLLPTAHAFDPWYELS